MSEKRFIWKTEKLQHSDDEVLVVVDNENKEWKGHILNIVDLLNSLAEENKILIRQKNILDRTLCARECECEKLAEENERLKNKLNLTALELVDEAISMGKAVEISEMNYHEFLEYRKKKGKPMELQR